MKKTQRRELFENIKKTKVSFISILIFVFLGVAIFTGISWTTPSFENSIDDVIQASNMYDIQVVFPYGLTEENIEQFKAVDGVDTVEPTRISYQFFECNGTENQAIVMQIGKTLNIPYEVEGELPYRLGEIAVDKNFAEANGLSIGDTITFSPDHVGEAELLKRVLNFDPETDDYSTLTASSNNASGMELLNASTYTITALCYSSSYIEQFYAAYGVSTSNNVSVDCFMLLPSDAFNYNAFNGYNSLYIQSNDLKQYNSFSKQYIAKVKEFSEKLSPLCEQIAEATCSKLHESVDTINANIQQQITDGEQQIADGKVQIEDGWQEVYNGRYQLRKARVLIADGEADYAASKAELDPILDAWNTVKKNADISKVTRQMCLDAVAKAKEINAKYPNDDLKKAINDFENAIPSEEDFETGKSILQSLIDALINEIDKEISPYVQQLADARETLDNAQEEYNESDLTLRTAAATLKEKEEELAQAEIDLQTAKDNYEQFQAASEQLKDYNCTLLTRQQNASVFAATTLCNIFRKIRFSMASLFLFVGLLVCYSAVSRIVYDQIIVIGTKKALGLMRKEITLSYLLYTGLAVVTGCILGVLAGGFIIEPLMVSTLGNTYIHNTPRIVINPTETLLVCGLEIGLILLITWFACKKTFSQNAVELLKGPKPPLGKNRFYEKTKLWNKLPLLTKTIINNCMNDSRRVVGTLIGIAGCTALIVSSITINNGVIHSYEKTYSDYKNYDMIINFDNTVSTAEQNIALYLSQEGYTFSPVVNTKAGIIADNGEYLITYIIVPLDYESFQQIDNIVPTKGSSDLDTSQGIWVCNCYEKYYAKQETEGIQLETLDGHNGTLSSPGFYKTYINALETIMSPEAYEEIYQATPKANAFFLNSNGRDMEELSKELSDIDGFRNIFNDQDHVYYTFGIFAEIAGILMAVFMILSVAMAALVLLNLLNMFVAEKKREIIILMINGFSIKDAKRYIYSDTIFLAIIGIICGIGLGILFGNIAISSFESRFTLYIHTPDLVACLVGAFGAALLTAIMSFVALRKIPQFKLSDINK